MWEEMEAGALRWAAGWRDRVSGLVVFVGVDKLLAQSLATENHPSNGPAREGWGLVFGRDETGRALYWRLVTCAWLVLVTRGREGKELPPNHVIQTRSILAGS